MTMNINQLNNVSSLLNSFSNSSSSKSSSIFSSDMFANLTNYNLYSTKGYKNLIKSYYQKDDNSTQNNNSISNYTSNNVSALKSSATELKTNADKLTNGDLFKQYTASSSAENVISNVSAKNVDNMPSSMKVDVSQIATKQKNTSNSIDTSKSAYSLGIDAGTYSFNINSNGKTNKISFSVGYSTTSEELQTKIADAINKSNSGVTAKINYSTDNNGIKSSFLTIESNETGTNSSFSIENNPNSKTDIVSKLGLDNTTTNAQNAIYKVNNGTTKTSQSNNVTLATGITATLKSVSNETINLNFDLDKTSIKSALKDFIESYNSVTEKAYINSDENSKFSNLYTQLLGNNKSNSKALARIGISVNALGGLSLNEDTFDKASSNDIKNVLTGNNSFVNNASKKASNILNNISSYSSTYNTYNKFGSNTYSSYSTYSDYF